MKLRLCFKTDAHPINLNSLSIRPFGDYGRPAFPDFGIAEYTHTTFWSTISALTWPAWPGLTQGTNNWF